VSSQIFFLIKKGYLPAGIIVFKTPDFPDRSKLLWEKLCFFLCSCKRKDYDTYKQNLILNYRLLTNSTTMKCLLLLIDARLELTNQDWHRRWRNQTVLRCDHRYVGDRRQVISQVDHLEGQLSVHAIDHSAVRTMRLSCGCVCVCVCECVCVLCLIDFV
jgi:hypothetical protein